MNNQTYFDNLRIIARSGGSPQARCCYDGSCPVCNERDEEEIEEEKND